MTSLVEVTDFPAGPIPRARGQPPLFSDLTLASVLTAAYETLPIVLADAFPAKALLQRLQVARPAPPLAHVAWLRALEQDEGNTLVLDRNGLTTRGGLLPDDHLFKHMARNGLIRDNHVIWSKAYASLPQRAQRGQAPSPTPTPAPAPAPAPAPLTPTVFNVYALSGSVCGHPGIVHGGLSSAIIDETFGYLLYLLAGACAPSERRRVDKPTQASPPSSSSASSSSAAPPAAVVETKVQAAAVAPGPEGGKAPRSLLAELRELDLRSAMTAHLEVDYVKPLPAGSTVVCAAQIDRVEGRKVWLRAQLLGQPDASTDIGAGAQHVFCDGKREIFAQGKALFITPRSASS